MEKFSFYDLLAVLFPGAVSVCLLNILLNVFGITSPVNIEDNWELIILISIFAGAFIYMISFWLTTKLKWIYRITGMYSKVGSLYRKAGIHDVLGDVLNKQANNWFGKDIFFSENSFNALDPQQKEEVCRLQDVFYDKMYYELDYADKLSTPKSFQSFYLFFRNVFVTTVFCMLLLVVSYLIHLIPSCNFAEVDHWLALKTFISLLVLFFVTNWTGRWYRKRMVCKMYWFFYSHINAIN